MKSKISFFNPTIFRKNIMLYSPIWVVYTAILIFSLPVYMWLRIESFYKNVYPVMELDEYQYSVVADTFGVPSHTVLIFAFAIIIGMAIFNYMYNSKSANMIHALPVTRLELFGTSVISGLTFLWVPQIISFIVSVLIALCNGITIFGVMAQWLIIVMIISFVAFSMVTFCAQFTGQVFALPVYYGALNILCFTIRLVFNQMIGELSYGVNYYWSFSNWDLLSPFLYIYRTIYSHVFYAYDKMSGVYYFGKRILPVYVVLALALYVLSYVAYRARKIESAGDLLVFKFVKPIFRWGVGICFGFSGACFGIYVLSETGFLISFKMIFLLTIVIGLLFFSVAEMFNTKKLRIYNKKLLMEMGAFVVVLMITFKGMSMYGAHISNDIPDIDEIESASIEDLFIFEYDDKDGIEKIIGWQEEILQNAADIKNECENADTDTINFKYTLKDGTIYKRSYPLAYINHGLDIRKKIMKVESQTEVVLENIFGYKYKECTEIIAGGYFQYYTGCEDGDGGYSTEMDLQASKALYDAIVSDVESGAYVECYADNNGNYSRLYDVNAEYSGYLDINLLIKDTRKYNAMDARFNDVMIWGYKGEMDGSYSEDITSVDIYFNNNCKNILECLNKFGLIE